MSKGRTQVSPRLGDDLIARIDADVLRQLEQPNAPFIDRAGWIRKACEERLAKRQRSRKTRKAKEVAE